MNLRRYILGTVAANLALVGALLWQAARMPAPAPRTGLAITTNVVTEYLNEPAAPAPEVKVPGSPPFHWSQVESTNYSTFMTNLLAIGCPKETALDILEARLADDFRARLRELTRPLQARFWEVAAAEGKFEDVFEDTPLETTVEELKAEKKRIETELQAALGREAKPGKPGRNEQFSHLPEEKQVELTELEDQHKKERDALNRDVAKVPPAERSAKQKELRERQQTERRALFTDGEWDEAELRRSPQAAKVRELRGFTATPEELRALVRTLRDFDNANPRPTPPGPNRPERNADFADKRTEWEAQRKQHLTARLGEPGFAALERASDPQFHTLLKLARRLELAPASAAQWLELQTAAQEQAGKTRQLVVFVGDRQALTPDALAVALRAIRAETERTLQAAVGPRGWGAYQRYAGDWLKQLDK